MAPANSRDLAAILHRWRGSGRGGAARRWAHESPAPLPAAPPSTRAVSGMSAPCARRLAMRAASRAEPRPPAPLRATTTTEESTESAAPTASAQTKRLTSPMRILWVKVGGLWPLNTGGRLRSFHIVSELSRRHRVTLLTTHGPADDPAGLAAALPRCEAVQSFPTRTATHGSARFVTALLRSWLSPLPVDLWKSRVAALQCEANRLTAAGEIDLCVADFLAAAPNVPMGGAVPTILFTHNVEHMIWKRLSETEGHPLQRALLEVEWRKMRRYEGMACDAADLTLAVSDVDRTMMAALAPTSCVRTIPTRDHADDWS